MGTDGDMEKNKANYVLLLELHSNVWPFSKGFTAPKNIPHEIVVWPYNSTYRHTFKNIDFMCL